MNRKKVNKKFKKNKYRLIIWIVALLAVFLVIVAIRKYNIEKEIAKYDNEILIVKGNGDQLESVTIKELRKSSGETKVFAINNGLEKIEIEGVPLEKIFAKLSFNLKDSAVLFIEDNDGIIKKIPMSSALEPERVYLVYKINKTPVYDLSKSYGKMLIIDTNQDSSSSWITNVKTLDIQWYSHYKVSIFILFN